LSIYIPVMMIKTLDSGNCNSANWSSIVVRNHEVAGKVGKRRWLWENLRQWQVR
jgi:hypothetical protein